MTTATRLGLAALAAALLVLLYLLRGMLLPFVAGMAIAYLLDPLVNWLEAKGLRRGFGAALLLVVFFGIFVLALVLIVPKIQSQIVGLAGGIPEIVSWFHHKLLPLLGPLFQGAVPAGLSKEAGAWIASALGGLLGSGLALVNLISLLLVTPVVAFYLLRDWNRVMARIDSWLPRGQAPVIRANMREVDNVLAGFVHGQVIVCAILAAYYGLVLTLLSLHYGLLIGILTGVFAFVPFIGTFFGFVTSTAVATVQFWPHYLSVALVVGTFAVGSFFESNILSPKLVGDRVRLHPVWVIFALLAFAALFGFVGILLAVPVAAVIGVLTRFAISRYLESELYHGGEQGGGPKEPK